MTFDDLIAGLEARGFQNTSGICGRGKTHLNEHHYVLLTDGLVIYSTKPHYDDSDCLREDWDANTFTFDKLDELLK